MFAFLDVSDLEEVKKTKFTANLYEELPDFDRKPQLSASNLELDRSRQQAHASEPSVCKVPLQEHAPNPADDTRCDLEKRPAEALVASTSKKPKKNNVQKVLACILLTTNT